MENEEGNLRVVMGSPSLAMNPEPGTIVEPCVMIQKEIPVDTACIMAIDPCYFWEFLKENNFVCRTDEEWERFVEAFYRNMTPREFNQRYHGFRVDTRMDGQYKVQIQCPIGDLDRN